MSTNELRTADGCAEDASTEAWSRQGSAMILPGGTALVRDDRTAPVRGDRTAPVRDDRTGPIRGDPAFPAADDAGVTSHDDAFDGSVPRTSAWSSVLSGPALAIAAFAFACAQAVGGLVAGPVSSLIPSAADSPANHVRIMAVIYIGMGSAGAVFAWLALRRVGDDAAAPRWASYLAGAAVAVCALVALQALVLLMLSILAPSGA